MVLVDDDLDGGLAAGDPGNAAAAPNLALRIDFGHASGVASRLEATALEVYFRIEQDSLRDRVFDLVVAAAPTVPQIISIALGIPGVDAQERAMGLLSRSIGGTLLFGRWLETILDALEPLYARKAVNIVLGGLGFVEAGHPAIDRCAAYIEHFLHDADPVNRQSAYDAMESLLATRGDAPSLNA
ncbi:MAG TPA: hypothetical protein VMS32_08440 [Verrucomicrobiae bacterium]|nr:hypothetical protein [Verrucomicrobiae bacterium]